MIRGQWARQRGDVQRRGRCFWEAIKRDPAHHAATYLLAQALQSMGDSANARRLSDRSLRLGKLSALMEILFQNRNNPNGIRSAAELTESLGCVWEAWAWHRVILHAPPDEKPSQAALQRLEPLLQDGPPLVLDSANPAKQIDLSNFPLPRWDAESPPAESSLDAGTGRLSNELCRMRPRGRSIDFRYFAGSESEDGRRMFQFTGGGVAVLDYDGDGWPDLYLTQGCRWPPQPGQTELSRPPLSQSGRRDVRRRHGERSWLDRGPLQPGSRRGDFNNDGFADLYVANVGVNRLYLNPGDGTFRDVSAEAGVEGRKPGRPVACWPISTATACPTCTTSTTSQGARRLRKESATENGIPRRVCTPTSVRAAARLAFT